MELIEDLIKLKQQVANLTQEVADLTNQVETLKKVPKLAVAVSKSVPTPSTPSLDENALVERVWEKIQKKQLQQPTPGLPLPLPTVAKHTINYRQAVMIGLTLLLGGLSYYGLTHSGSTAATAKPMPMSAVERPATKANGKVTRISSHQRHSVNTRSSSARKRAREQNKILTELEAWKAEKDLIKSGQ